jgi:hypothetical protein
MEDNKFLIEMVDLHLYTKILMATSKRYIPKMAMYLIDLRERWEDVSRIVPVINDKEVIMDFEITNDGLHWNRPLGAEQAQVDFIKFKNLLLKTYGDKSVDQFYQLKNFKFPMSRLKELTDVLKVRSDLRILKKIYG